MRMSLAEARGIVRSLPRQQPTPQPPPFPGAPTPGPDDGLPPSSGGPPRPGGGSGSSGGAPSYEKDPKTGLWYDTETGAVAPQWLQKELNERGGGGIRLPTFEDSSGAKGEGALYQDENGIWRYSDGAAAPLWMQKELNGVGSAGSGGGSGRDPMNDVPESSRFGRDIFESDRDYSRGVLESDRNFGQSQLQDNRTEMGNRAGTAISTGNLLLDMARRNDDLANDPGNFPAWLQAMQQNETNGPVVSSLVGQGVQIRPQEGNYLDDPRFKSVIDSVLEYARVPTGGEVSAVQGAYNQDPDAAQRWFEAAAALDKSRGMADGGTMRINRPMRFQDIATGETLGVAGEQGDETISVSPTEGTSRAIGRTLGASGFSFISPDVRQKWESGNIPLPGEMPDWQLNKLPPSIRILIQAAIKSRLGSAGLSDYDWTRQMYSARGFDNPVAGVVR